MMPPEGPNKSEELLQRYAKERREQGGDFSLHPATRQLLQGEVARQFKGASADKPKAAAWWTWFTTWPGRFAVGTACVAAGLAAWVYWNNSQSGSRMEMAQTAKPDVDVFFDGAQGVEPPPADVALAERENLGRESKKMLGDEQGVKLEARKQQQDAKEGFGSKVEFYAMKDAPATNALNFGVSLQAAQRESDFLTSGTGAMTNISIAASGPRGGLAVNQPKVDLGAAVTEPAKGLALLDRMETAPSASRSETERAAAARPDPVTRSRSGDLAGTPAAPAQPPGTPTSSLTPAAPAATATPAAPSVVAGVAATAAPEEPLSRRMDASAANTTRFYRTAPSGPAGTAGRALTEQPTLAKEKQNSAADFRVLARFVVEQQTNVVLLHDADGSVYSGTLFAASADKLAEFSEARDKDRFDGQKTEALADSPSPVQLGYSFRASGSNVTLRQVVEITGRLTPATNASALGVQATPAPAERRFTIPARPNLRTSTSPADSEVIDGTVRVGTGATEPFRALRQTTPQ